MPNYRRWFIAGGSFFFTVVTYQRRRVFEAVKSIVLLGQVMRECRIRWPVTVNAIVVLPDHLHTIWTLPPEDAGYPKRWGWIKKEFSKRWLARKGHEQPVSIAHKRERRCGVWQPRYWEYTLDDVNDFERHFDYIHWNPVKHGYVRCPHEWPHSSFHRCVKGGIYDRNWGCFQSASPPSFQFADIADTTGEQPCVGQAVPDA